VGVRPRCRAKNKRKTREKNGHPKRPVLKQKTEAQFVVFAYLGTNESNKQRPRWKIFAPRSSWWWWFCSAIASEKREPGSGSPGGTRGCTLHHPRPRPPHTPTPTPTPDTDTRPHLAAHFFLLSSGSRSQRAGGCWVVVAAGTPGTAALGGHGAKPNSLTPVATRPSGAPVVEMATGYYVAHLTCCLMQYNLGSKRLRGSSVTERATTRCERPFAISSPLRLPAWCC
jgi:hypothetical protein